MLVNINLEIVLYLLLMVKYFYVNLIFNKMYMILNNHMFTSRCVVTDVRLV